VIASVRRLAVGTAVAASLAGCGGSVAGQPAPTTGSNPGSTGSTGSQAPTGPTTTTTTSTAAPIADLTNSQLCALLTASEATQLGGSDKGEPGFSVTTAHPLCQWSKDTTLNIDFGKDTRSSQAPTGDGITNTPTTVAGLSAVLSHKTGTREFCQVIVDVTATAAMAFGSGLHDSGKGRYEPCDVARRLADIVIPKVKG
jgi:hypothetical protein